MWHPPVRLNEQLVYVRHTQRSGHDRRAADDGTLDDREALVAALRPPDVEGPVTAEDIPFTQPAKKTLELALRAALLLGHNYIGTEHLLLGLLDEEDGLGARTLTDLGVTKEAAEQWLVPE